MFSEFNIDGSTRSLFGICWWGFHSIFTKALQVLLNNEMKEIICKGFSWIPGFLNLSIILFEYSYFMLSILECLVKRLILGYTYRSPYALKEITENKSSTEPFSAGTELIHSISKMFDDLFDYSGLLSRIRTHMKFWPELKTWCTCYVLLWWFILSGLSGSTFLFWLIDNYITTSCSANTPLVWLLG